MRERKKDIPLLIDHFINKYSDHPLILDQEIIEYLIHRSWEGNIRELEKWIKRLVRRFPKGGKLSI